MAAACIYKGMNTTSVRPFFVLFTVVMLFSCDSSLTGSRYSLNFPDLPPVWALVLPPPHWRIEWQNSDGKSETLIINSGRNPEISLPNTFTSAVLAWPYWPEKGIEPGIFMPAGALFPFDIQGTDLSLSWKGGIDVIFYRELEKVGNSGPGTSSSVPRLPLYFNWPRFRELFSDPTVNSEVRGDPWLADWPQIAEKTWQTGFDKRRLVPQARNELAIPGLDTNAAPGPWIGVSPFAAPLYFDATPVFPVRTTVPGTVDIWVSARGILHCSPKAWIFFEFE